MPGRLLALLIFALSALSLPLAVQAQEDLQYRRIELIDGSVLYVRILDTDAETLRVQTRKGDALIPWMDVLDLTDITREDYEAHATLRLAYIATTAADAELQPTADAVSARFQDAVGEAPLVNLLRGPTLDTRLGPERRAALKSCDLEDQQCVGDAVAAAELQGYIYGRVEPAKDQVRATFVYVSLVDSPARRDVTVPFKRGELPAQSSLLAAVWHLLQLDERTLPQTGPDAAPTTVATGAPRGDSDSSQGRSQPSAADPAAAGAGEAATSRGVFIPLPGAPALFARQGTKVAASAGAVAVLTGATVYVVGGVGLGVPWDEDEAQWADPVFLTGVGVVSYVAFSLITNQIVARTLKPRKAQAARLQLAPSPGGLTLRF